MASVYDFYAMDEELSDEERLVRDSVHRLVRERVLPDMARHYREGTFPVEVVPLLAAQGLLGGNLSGHGCAGMGEVAYGLAMQELEWCDSGIRTFCSVQSALAMYPIWAFGTEAQQARYLPAMARGEIIGCFGLTEPETGSDPSALRCRAERLPGGGYRLHGHKHWITNGNLAHVAVVWAKLAGVVHGFLVPTDARGFRAVPIEDKLSMRASVTSELLLEGVEVAEDALLRGVAGMRGPLSCLTQARFGIAWGALGAARCCFETALEYAKGRVQFGKPIAGHQLVQAKLVDMLAKLTQAQCLTLRLGRLKEAGKVEPAQVSLAKRNNVAAALEVARAARDILGAVGITGDYPVARHMMNLETVNTYEGTHDIHTLILGQAITGRAAFE